MGKRIVHMWRCINCGKMTDAYMCTHCGKESYVKDWSETTIQDEKPKLTEKLISKSDKEKIYTTVPSPETEINGLKKEVTNLAERMDINRIGASKAIKSIAWALSVLFIVQAVMLGINFIGLKREVHSLEEKNKEQSSLVHSQSKIISSLEKPVTEISDSQIKYIVHTVKKGETLTDICRQYNIDYEPNRGIICSLNGIENPNTISIGQKLLLPVLD